MIQLDRTLRTLRRISHTRYPQFLFGLPLAASEIPIFTYHDVTVEGLSTDLEFLKCNGYRTLSLSEFEERNGRPRGRREVLLTFDDARKSAARVALPVLKEFDARAVLFAPTRWIRTAEEAADSSRSLFMSWEELRRCHESGVFTVESHAHRHALVHVSSRLAAFATPDALRHYDIYDWPMRRVGGEGEQGFPPLGTPVYEAAPLLSARRCYVESARTERICQELVMASGGAEFFSMPHALSVLRKVHDHAQQWYPGTYLDPAALDALIRSEFELSRKAFLQHLGHAPRWLAFPWMVGSDVALRHAKEAGIVGVMGCALDFRRARAQGLPLPVYGRFKSDWLRLLPGKERISLAGVLAHKLGEITSQHLAH